MSQARSVVCYFTPRGGWETGRNNEGLGKKPEPQCIWALAWEVFRFETVCLRALDVSASGDFHDITGHVAGQVTGQEQGNVGYFFWRAKATQWNLLLA
ncbi:hypothetical protein M2119_000804 [Aurantimicrobium minutum]|nr:hypothetical protein [Aurantimicrobium minutum]